MGFQNVNEFVPKKQIIWQHHWSDGSRLELTQDKYDWILIEYHADGSPAYYTVQNGYEQTSTCEERYSKKNTIWRDNICYSPTHIMK